MRNDWMWCRLIAEPSLPRGRPTACGEARMMPLAMLEKRA